MNLREERAQQRANKRQKHQLFVGIIVGAVVIICSLIVLAVVLDKTTPDEIETTTAPATAPTEDPLSLEARQDFRVGISAIKEKIFAPGSTVTLEVEAALAKCEDFGGKYTVFISIGNSEKQAKVFHSSSASIAAAWDGAEALAEQYAYDNKYDSKYVKADIVDYTDRILTEELPALVEAESEWYGQFFRKGISLDTGFELAFLEAQVNASELIDYDNTKGLRLAYVNKAIPADLSFTALPAEITVFSCRGFIYDGAECYSLVSDSVADYGRRVVETPDADYVTGLVKKVIPGLVDKIDSTGKFAYGVYPLSDTAIPSYDVARHAAAASALIQYSKQLDGAGLYDDKIAAVMDWLVNSVTEPTAATAYYVDAENKEIRLEDSAAAICAIADYCETKGDEKYNPTAVKLGMGIIANVDPSTAFCSQALYFGDAENDDLSVKSEEDEKRLTSVDSYIVYSLCRLYTITKTESFLNSAKRSASQMNILKYYENTDPWLAAAMNELTKYADNEEYYNLALKNAGDNLESIYLRKASSADIFNMMLDTYEVYKRAKETGAAEDYIATLDEEYFTRTILRRAEMLLNGFGFPEYAMYFINPATVLDHYFVRNDDYRIRIDDTAVFVQAYLRFAEKYTDITADHDAAQAIAAAEAATATATSTAVSATAGE